MAKSGLHSSFGGEHSCLSKGASVFDFSVFSQRDGPLHLLWFIPKSCMLD